jgi:hypothetical protein
LTACCLWLVSSWTPAAAQDFRVFPNSKIDEKASRQASANGSQCQVYVTSDSFDKVYAFYKDLYKEHVMPGGPKLPSGEQVKWAFFLIDGGKDLAHSKYWMKIQRPYIGTIDDGTADFKDIRNVTVIQTVRRN